MAAAAAAKEAEAKAVPSPSDADADVPYARRSQKVKFTGLTQTLGQL
jgi:hypothetical protein